MTIQNQLKLLFATFPPPPGDEVGDQLQAYAIALEGHTLDDVEAAVRKFLRGEVVGHNQSFAPSASLLGGAVRQCLHDRLDAEHRERRRRPALPPPDIAKTPESQARVKAMTDRIVKGLASSLRTDEAEAEHQRQLAQLRKTNDYFDRQRGYSVGDPVQDEVA